MLCGQKFKIDNRCCNLNKNVPHRLRVESLGKGIRRCGFVRVGVALLEEGCHWGSFWVSNAQVRPSVPLFLLPTNPDIGLSATSPAPCLLM